MCKINQVLLGQAVNWTLIWVDRLFDKLNVIINQLPLVMWITRKKFKRLPNKIILQTKLWLFHLEIDHF